MPKKPEPVNDHGITCSCARWCQTVHTGNASNCPDQKGVDNVGQQEDNDNRSVVWLPDPFIEAIVAMVTNDIKNIKIKIKQRIREDGMLSAKEILKRQAASGDGGALLHGSNVPKQIKSFKITVTDVREAPANFNAAIILDIKEIYGCTAFAVNKTNLNALASKFGDDLDKIKGKTFSMDVVLANNPRTKENTRGLRVSL